MLMARDFPVILVYTKARFGQHAYQGNVLTLNNVQNRGIITFTFHSEGGNKSMDFKVRRKKD